MLVPIMEFRDEFAFLSNFYVEKNGFTVEHRFQAMKTLDGVAAQRILRAPDARTAKKWGREADLRPDWQDVKVVIMAELIAAKFWNDSDLANALNATGHRPLYEGNTWNDREWGVDLETGVGKNMLGIILMTTRSNLRIAGKVPQR